MKVKLVSLERSSQEDEGKKIETKNVTNISNEKVYITINSTDIKIIIIKAHMEQIMTKIHSVKLR